MEREDLQVAEILALEEMLVLQMQELLVMAAVVAMVVVELLDSLLGEEVLVEEILEIQEM